MNDPESDTVSGSGVCFAIWNSGVAQHLLRQEVAGGEQDEQRDVVAPRHPGQLERRERGQQNSVSTTAGRVMIIEFRKNLGSSACSHASA